MRTRSILYGGVLLAAACTDSPVETERASNATVDVAAAVAASNCTKTWASGIGGLWADPSRWSPAGVPGPNDDVCIAAPGKYTILATQSIDVRSLVIGGDSAAVTVDFDPPLTGIGIDADVILGILPGSELNILSKGLVPLSGGMLVNFGTVDIDNVCACGGDVAILTFDRIDNLKRMDLDAPMSINSPLWTNASRGVIVTRGQGVIAVQDGGAMSNWGQIVGSTQIRVDNFLWADGRVGEIALATSAVLVTAGTLDMSAITDAASGYIEADTEQGDVTVSGRVPTGVTVEILARKNRPIELEAAGTAAEFTVDGTLKIASNGTNPLEFNRLVVNGMLDIRGTGDIEVSGNELVNEGTLLVWGSDIAFVSKRATFLQSGDIGLTNPITLTMGPGTVLVQDGYSPPTLTVELNGATLRGTGSVGKVTSLGGTIEPDLWRRLIVYSLTLDGASELVIPYDDESNGEVYASGPATFGGTLRLREVNPAAGLGRCGDVIPAVVHPGVTPTGAFATHAGMNSGGGDWRVAQTPDELIIAGYDPTRDVAIRYDGAAAREGVSPAFLEVCLGPNAPTGDVVVTATPELGQLIPPAAVTFAQASWQAPREILVDAVDDAVIEPLHYDTLAYTLSSLDPRYNGPLADRTAVAILDNDGNADIDIVVQNAPSAVTAGSVFEVVYRVTNNGPTAYTGGFFVLPPPAGAGTVALEQVYGVVSCAQDPNGIDYCNFAGGNPGESRLIPVVYRATGAGAVTLGATVYSYQPDPSAMNDSVQVQITVN